jgi:hypothetical protein
MQSKLMRCIAILGLLGTITHGASAWTLQRDFNSGAIGQRVSKADGLDSAQGRTVYSNEVVYEGASSARLSILEGQEGWGTWGGVVEFPEKLKTGDEVWYRIRTYYPEGFDYFSYAGGSRLKFLRVHTAGASGKHEGYNDILIDMLRSSNAFIFGFEGENRWKGIGPKKALPAFNTWETYELYIKFHPVAKASGGQAVVRFWKNGELLGEITDRKTLVSGSSVATRALLFTYWNGGAPQTQSMWVDDLVITSETPATKDAKGNPFIGMGSPQFVAPPAAPVLKVGQ